MALTTRDGWSRLRLLVAVLVLLGCVAVYAMPVLRFPRTGLEGGWHTALNAAAAAHLVFGRDIIFTFGPYGGLFSSQYDPAIDGRLVAGALLFAAAAAGGLVAIARGWLWPLVVLLPLYMLTIDSPDALLLALPAIFLLLGWRLALPARHPRHLSPTAPRLLAGGLLVLALALLPLVKGSFGAAGIGELAVVVTMLAWRRATGLAVAAVALFLAGLAGFWLLIGQPITALPGFFTSMRPIISGYFPAMALSGPREQVLGLAVAALLLLLLADRALAKRTGAAGWGLRAGLLLLLFVAAKAGLVRQDEHAAITAGVIGVLGCLLALQMRLEAATATLLVGLAGWGLVATPMAAHGGRLRVPPLRPGLAQAAGDLGRRLFDRAPLDRRYTAALDAIRAAAPFPDLAAAGLTDPGRFDIYPVEQTLPLAHRLQWSPRPVFQSYSAYAPALAEANRQHLLGPDAPDTIAFHVETIDNRLPALDDGPSWPVLMQRYRVMALQHDFALLRRRPGSGAVLDPATAAPLLRASVALGQWLELPRGQAIWARITLDPTWLGRLAGLALKPPLLKLSLRHADGQVREFRYIAAMGVSGFLLSPIVTDTAGFVAVATNQPALQPGAAPETVPVAMTITGASGTRLLWSPTYQVTLTPFVVPAPPIPPGPAVAATVGGTCRIELVARRDGGGVRVAGWAAVALADGIAGEALRITLTGPDGIEQVVAAPPRLERPDVGSVYGHPALGPTGFDVTLDLAGRHGPQRVGLQLDQAGATLNCPIERVLDPG